MHGKVSFSLPSSYFLSYKKVNKETTRKVARQIQEQTEMVAEDNNYNDTMKGKRGKRPRSGSVPLALTMATSSSSTANIGGGGNSTGSSVLSDISGSSDHYMMTLNSGYEFKKNVEEEEEEDMANCLILLAKGRRQVPSPTVAGAAEFYRCKTCNKSFSSFQALGGHRASHKKPMIKPFTTTAEGGNPSEERVGGTILSLKMIRSTSDLALGGGGTIINKSRVHECSICGAEFASGQALGGHMRRHRPLAPPPSENSSHGEYHDQEKKPRKILLLDLNLPAPEELVFSANSTPLINCHY